MHGTQRAERGCRRNLLRVIWIRRSWSSDADDDGRKLVRFGSFNSRAAPLCMQIRLRDGHQDAIGVVGRVCQILGRIAGFQASRIRNDAVSGILGVKRCNFAEDGDGTR